MSESRQKPLTAGCHSPRSISDQSGAARKNHGAADRLAVIARCGLRRQALRPLSCEPKAKPALAG